MSISNQKNWFLDVHPETLAILNATQSKGDTWPQVAIDEEIATEWISGCCGFDYQIYKTGTTYCLGPKISEHKRIRQIQTDEQPFVRYTIWYQQSEIWCEDIDSITVYAVASDNELIIRDKILVQPSKQQWAQPDDSLLYCDYGHVFARLRI